MGVVEGMRCIPNDMHQSCDEALGTREMTPRTGLSLKGLSPKLTDMSRNYFQSTAFTFFSFSFFSSLFFLFFRVSKRLGKVVLGPNPHLKRNLDPLTPEEVV